MPTRCATRLVKNFLLIWGAKVTDNRKMCPFMVLAPASIPTNVARRRHSEQHERCRRALRIAQASFRPSLNQARLQRQRERRTDESRPHLLLEHAHCVLVARPRTGDSVLGFRGTVEEPLQVGHEHCSVRFGSLPAGCTRGGGTHVAAVGDSSHAREREQGPPGADGTAGSPGEVWRWRGLAIGTAPAMNTDDNCGCWLRRPRAGSHRLLGDVHGPPVAAQPDSAGCRPAGGQSLDR